jgi:hypothetical protein
MSKPKHKNLEEFIRENQELFNKNNPPKGHKDAFLQKLRMRFHHFINIVPYLLRVAIATIIIFIASIIIWNNYIRKDRDKITLKHKIEKIIQIRK